MSNFSARTVIFLKISLYKHFLETNEEQDSPTQDKFLGDSSVYLSTQVGKRQTKHSLWKISCTYHWKMRHTNIPNGRNSSELKKDDKLQLKLCLLSNTTTEFFHSSEHRFQTKELDNASQTSLSCVLLDLCSLGVVYKEEMRRQLFC